jgi:pimeloyl-ACP methyl ester carboxylesterase
MRPPGSRTGYAVASADGAPLFYELTRAPKARAVVVLCDGIGCDGYVWKYLRPVLLEHYDLLHWHYPGHGRSPAPRASRDRRLSIADLADDLVAVMDDAGIDRAVVFGHSMGVQVSLETYRRHRDRVTALGLFCGAPGNPLRTFRRTEALERLLPGVRAVVSRAPRLAARLTRSLVPTGLSYMIAAQVEVNGRLLDQADFMPYLRGLADVDPTLFLEMLAHAGEHSARDLLPHIKVPALIVAGTRDGFTPPELSTAMAEEIPGAELLEVHDGSHTAPLERPHFVNAAVTAFLVRHFG